MQHVVVNLKFATVRRGNTSLFLIVVAKSEEDSGSFLAVKGEILGSKPHFRRHGLFLAYYLDGRITAIFGTHTHVLTADERVLPGGSGYITDIGMCGVQNSVLGVKKEVVIEKFMTNMPVRFDAASGECMLNGCIFTVDEKSGKCTAAETVRIF